VLDGYPRTTAEPEALRETLARLDRLLPRPSLLCLEVAQDDLVQRLRRRRQCEGRADDAERCDRPRLELHFAQIGSVVEALGSWVDVVRVDGDRPIDAVTEEILDIVGVRLGRSSFATLDAPAGRRAWKPPSTSPRDAGETDLSSPT
jgi:adenylate kinase